MTNKIVPVKVKNIASKYEVEIGSSALDNCGAWATSKLSSGHCKIALISNKKVFALYGEQVRKSLASRGFSVVVCLIGDGESYKNMLSLQKVLRFLGENSFTRTDTIVALGGGVVGDLAGFAAAIYLRGIAFLQIPTTLLSMIDSSVGGKTGINTEFGKNLVGAFHQPKGVLIDMQTLATLPTRELTAGLCEAVKQGAVSGIALLNKTRKILEKLPARNRAAIFADNALSNEIIDLLSAQIAFKAKIVESDERESVDNAEPTSRKILNFGHTLAHALEKATDYRYFKHGEAVGYGVLFATSLSKKLGLLDRDAVILLNDAVKKAGRLPAIRPSEPNPIIDTFKYDKKVVDDSLQWILLKGIGKPVIVPHSAIPNSVVRDCLRQIITRYK